MALRDDLIADVTTIFQSMWTTRQGQVVPEPADLGLGNDGVYLDATVLYADMAGSTKMVDGESAEFAAEIYKSYLVCAARIIKSEGGAITAYDGDRIMAVFIGGSKNTNAVRAALKINWAVQDIVTPRMLLQYPTKTFRLQQTVGIDTSRLLVARIGVRNDNDLVWVGRAANYAAKLSDIDDGLYRTFITADVYNTMNASVTTSGSGVNMWEQRFWQKMNNMIVYRSHWRWGV